MRNTDERGVHSLRGQGGKGRGGANARLGFHDFIALPLGEEDLGPSASLSPELAKSGCQAHRDGAAEAEPTLV
jgi:hypothetical protein